MLEKTIQAEILAWLRGHGYYVWRENSAVSYTGGRMIRAGTPGVADIIGLTKKGRFLAIEVKTQTGKQTFLQAEFEKAVKANKGIYILARDLSDVLAVLGEDDDRPKGWF